MASHRRRRAFRGFTLLEMLVVLLVMGVCVGLLTAALQPDDTAVLRAEAERLARLLELAADESRLTGKTIAWTADASGYRFLQSGPQADWARIRDNAMLRERTLPLGTALALRVENAAVPGPLRLEFTPEAATFAYTLELSLGLSRMVVVASPVGEMRVRSGEEASGDDLARQ